MESQEKKTKHDHDFWNCGSNHEITLSGPFGAYGSLNNQEVDDVLDLLRYPLTSLALVPVRIFPPLWHIDSRTVCRDMWG